jgi:ribosome biogenesis GTPase
LIDRYLIAIENSRAAPLICVNKSDLLDQSGPPLEVEIYRALSIPVLLCSAATGQGIEELAVALAGKTCVFTGHSGVGKSSLLNALAPDLGLATGAISAAHGRGRHTTTSATLHVLPNGATIIDTPGIREFGLWRVGRDDLRSYFPEMRDLAVFCEFRDCTHTHEPVCAVKEAVERGSIARARYAAYLRIWQTL